MDNEYHLITFDAGAAATGWTWFVVDFHAFSRPEANWLHWIKSWDCGEFSGTEYKILKQCVGLVNECQNHTSYLSMDVVAEGFELTQMIGGKNLLSPVRINSVIGWECQKKAIKFHEQSRSLRTNVTRGRLSAWGFEGKFKKDEFAAMQHAIVWIRRLKQESREMPWKLSESGVLNAGGWDCSCRKYKQPCNMWHPHDR
jgi:hypothetical protein